MQTIDSYIYNMKTSIVKKQNFSDFKEDIEKALHVSIQKSEGRIVDKDGFILVNGFISLPIKEDLYDNNLLPKSIPTVAIVGKSTGLIYSFALKALMPDIQL